MVKSVTKNYTAPSFLFDNLAITHYILEIVVFFFFTIPNREQTDGHENVSSSFYSSIQSFGPS